MDEKNLTSQLRATFLGELDERMQSLNEDLLVLEKSGREEQRKECIQRLFRTAHALKGASRAANIPEIERAFHRVEAILTSVSEGSGSLGTGSLDLLFTVVDALQDAGDRLRRHGDLADGPLAALLPRLEEAARDSKSELASPEPKVPASQAAAAGEPEGERPAAPILPEAGDEYRSIRIPLEKLDRLVSRNDELMVAARLLSSRTREVLQLHEFMERWQRNWRAMGALQDKQRKRRRAARQAGAAVYKPASQSSAMTEAFAGATDNIRHLERQLDQLGAALARDTHVLAQAGASITDDIGSLRMVPLSEACAGLARVARDAAKMEGKEAALAIEGANVELDRAIVQKLKSPLIQLVRNAVTHGIESPGQRKQAGKTPSGTITVTASVRGAHVEVVVADDGGGLPMTALRAKAAKRGLPEPVDKADFTNLVFQPGISTTPIVTELSGRGMGLDVVKTELEALHGTVELQFEEGLGTRFTLSLPLTLTATRGLAVSAAGRAFAFVGTNVKQLLRIKTADFRFIDGRDTIIVDKCPIPVASLARTLGIPEDQRSGTSNVIPVVVIAAGERQMAFVVDDLLAERELVIRSLGRRLKQVKNIAGATQFETGQVALILNASELIRSAVGQTAGRSIAAADAEAQGSKTKAHLIVADDSITTRTLEKTILESAGYEVTVAKDGLEAWDLLQLRGADLVVSDVEMPGLSGFELTAKIRNSKRFGDLPVVLVTSRSDDADKARGAEAGANAYLVKSSFDQVTLLETIAQLL